MLSGFTLAPSTTRDDDRPMTSANWNVKPTNSVEMAFLHDDVLRSTTARWWFVPHWHKKDVKEWKATTFNAKIETAHEKPTFRTAWKSSRCIIPASGYYEWTGPKGAKQPWWIAPKINAPVFFFAGLHSWLSDGTRTCTIITRPALKQIEHLHARTPVMLAEDEVKPWLTISETDDEVIGYYGTQWEDRMDFHKVKPIGKDDHGPELIEPL